ncbi:adenylate kinase [bacterium]|nr:adenylate kinase [Candidatus Omnitrophota bacterium]MBU2528209.1 adenylate kinase [bacterium]MBU3929587.1 adenylate kinase [bacterium]MBU4122993.1 adenylate kinase [bacterium]
MICIFLGAPGSGKGTQAKKVCAAFGMKYIGTGEILRDNVASGTELGKRVKATLVAGHLVDDETMIQIIEEKIKKEDSFLMDGFPRTVPQAEALDGLFEKYGKKVNTVIFLDVDAGEVTKRILGRFSCPSCGKDYNVYTDDIKDRLCPSDGADLIQRSDDTEETVRERIEEYSRKTAPLKEFYENRKSLINVRGTGSPSEIFERITEALDNKN